MIGGRGLAALLVYNAREEGYGKGFSNFCFENGFDLFSLGYETVPSPHHRGTGQTVKGISGRRNIARGRQREAAVSLRPVGRQDRDKLENAKYLHLARVIHGPICFLLFIIVRGMYSVILL